MNTNKTMNVATFLAAMMLVTGCGGEKRKPITVDRAKLPGSQQQPRLGPDGKPLPNQPNPTNQPNQPNQPVKNDPDADKKRAEQLAKKQQQFDEIEKAQSQLKPGAAILKENLDAGKYTINAVATSAYYLNGNQEMRAIHFSNVNISGGFQIQEAQPTKSFATSVDSFDLDGRELDLPAYFTIETAGKFPNRDAAANVVLKTLILNSGITTNTSNSFGNYTISDVFQNQNGMLKASVMNILSSNQVSIDKNNSNDRAAYSVTDEKGVQVNLHIYKQDAQTIIVHVEFWEKSADSSKRLRTDNNTTFIRNVFLTYKLDKSAATNPPANPPPAGTSGPVNNNLPDPTDTPKAGTAPTDVQLNN